MIAVAQDALPVIKAVGRGLGIILWAVLRVVLGPALMLVVALVALLAAALSCVIGGLGGNPRKYGRRSSQHQHKSAASYWLGTKR